MSARAAVLLLAWCAAGTAAHADPSLAARLAKVYQRVLADPTDVSANLAYARLAEEAGQPRKALATYERILLHDPDNLEARAALNRLRRQLKPEKTLVTLQTGIGYESNPFLLHGDYRGDGRAFASATIEDERNLGDQRWRTVILGSADYFFDSYQLDYGYAGIETGPMFETERGTHFNPFVGGGISTLHNDYYYSQALGGFSAGGYLDGAYSEMRVAAGYRSFGDETVSTDGFFADAIGRVSRPAVITGEDVVVLVPHLRWSGVGGAALGYGPNDLKPGRYFEWGAGVLYYDQVADWLTLGAGFNIEQTLYADFETAHGDDRADWTFSPAASAVFNGALGFQTDIALDYRYDWNQSNDDHYDYGNHVVTARVVTRF